MSDTALRHSEGEARGNLRLGMGLLRFARNDGCHPILRSSIGNPGFTDEELRRYLGGAGKDENEIPEIKGEPQTRLGDLIVLGSHRLLCGDSRDKEMIEALAEGEKVNHIFAGPPYFNQREYAHWQEYCDYLLDMGKIIENCRDVL